MKGIKLFASKAAQRAVARSVFRSEMEEKAKDPRIAGHAGASKHNPARQDGGSDHRGEPQVMSDIDLAEALRLIRKHMEPGDTLGKMFLRVAKELDGELYRQALRDCQTLTPSLMAGDDAIERLKQINRHVYDVLGVR
ncbi:MAG TPA: hypothetical protein VJ692_15655 [Nitrospiraceae bacterium]|nr:hypothetical protein [Nitrospiraceae bacterium]